MGSGLELRPSARTCAHRWQVDSSGKAAPRAGNVDLKLGFFIHLEQSVAPNAARSLIQALKRAGNVNMVVSYVAILVYSGHRGIHALGKPKNAAIGQRPITERAGQGSGVKKRPLRIRPVTQKIQRLKILADDHTAHFSIRISLWTILLVAFVGGVFSGFSWRRRCVTSDALDGLRPSESPRTSPSERILLKSSFPRVTERLLMPIQRQRRHSDRAGHAYRPQSSAHRSVQSLHNIFAGPKIRLAFVRSIDRCGHRDLQRS